jgi:hypothetical protein
VFAGIVEVHVGKLNKGEDFPSLDMLTTLLPSKDLRKVGERPLIEVLDPDVGKEKEGGEGVTGDGEEIEGKREEEEWAWGVDDQISATEAEVS